MKKSIDFTLFWPGILLTIALSLPLAIWPQAGGEIVNRLFDFMTFNFKWLFLAFGLFCVLFLIWLALSKWGNIKMGGTG